MSHREDQPATPDGEPNLPWMAGADDPGYFAAEESAPDALMRLQVSPSVHILVDSSYQLSITVKGGGPVAVNPSVLFDAVNFGARYIASHQPGPGSAPPKEDK